MSRLFAFDAGWTENDHKRASNGQFGSGGASKPAKHAEPSHFRPDEPSREGQSLHGVTFKTMKTPSRTANWNKHEGVNRKLAEPDFEEKFDERGKPKRKSSGIVMHEPDGRVWLVRPSKGFGGYKWTFPKGGIEGDEGLTPQGNALKETYEESGLMAAIDGHHADVEGDTSVTRFYKGHRIGGSPDGYGWETDGTALVHPNDLLKYLNRARDRKFAVQHLGTPAPVKAKPSHQKADA